MKKLNRFLIACMVAGVATACVTDDPRGTLRDPHFAVTDKPGGLGELCGGGFRSCNNNFTCYDEDGDGVGYCLTPSFAAACTAAPSCGAGFCVARGTTTLATFCNCNSGFVWNSSTCIADTYPEWPGTVLGKNADGDQLTCPAKELAPGTPDDSTANCPADTFCTEPEEDGAGDCLEYFVEIDGSISSNPFGGSVNRGDDEFTDAECIREYYTDGSSNGVQLVITGNLASTLFLGATNVTFDISEFDSVGGGWMRVWPQTGAPDPAGDSGFVDFSVAGALGDFDEGGIGGYVSIDSVSGPDADDDDLIDDGEGAIGASFFLGFGGTDFVAGAFTVNCGNNVDLGAAP